MPALTRLQPHRLRPLALALALGGSGGALFAWLGTPLPWMLGAMLFTTVAALAGVRIAVPRPLRLGMAVIVGILTGSAFTPSVFAGVASWAPTIAALVLYVVLAMALGIANLRRIGGYDPVTAFFTASPGSFTTMTLVGAHYGGDERVIALSHAMRILLIVATVPVFLHVVGSHPSAGAARVTGEAPSLRDLVVLGGCALGFYPARWLGIRAEYILGPLALSAIVHLAGLTAAKPPAALIIAAQIIIGAFVGARFVGLDLRRVWLTLFVGAGAAIQLILLSVAFAMVLHPLTGFPMTSLLLVFMPGGVGEMALIALAVGVEPAFVVTHHLARMVFLGAIAPVFFTAYVRCFGK